MPRLGYQSQSKTFETRAEALAWAVQVEAAMRSPTYEDPSVLKGITLAAALRRYAEKVSVHKKSNQQERNRIERLCRHPMGQRYIRDLRACDFAACRDERLQQVGANAVRQELALLSHLCTIAIEEWSWPLQRQLRNVQEPSPPRGRKRRLYEDEQQRLLDAIARPTRRQCAP